jgi:hypothetical protein
LIARGDGRRDARAGEVLKERQRRDDEDAPEYQIERLVRGQRLPRVRTQHGDVGARHIADVRARGEQRDGVGVGEDDARVRRRARRREREDAGAAAKVQHRGGGPSSRGRSFLRM